MTLSRRGVQNENRQTTQKKNNLNNASSYQKVQVLKTSLCILTNAAGPPSSLSSCARAVTCCTSRSRGAIEDLPKETIPKGVRPSLSSVEQI